MMINFILENELEIPLYNGLNKQDKISERPLARLLGLESIPNPVRITKNPLDEIKEENIQGVSGKVLINKLFSDFCKYGFKYSINANSAEKMLVGGGIGSEVEPEEYLSGNCLALAKAFEQLLTLFNIESEARYVWPENRGHFIVKPMNFIDASVKGNIKVNDGLTGDFIFSSHGATWVESQKTYYDPMAGNTYTDMASELSGEWTLQGDTKAYDIASTYKATEGTLKATEELVAGDASLWVFNPNKI